MTERQASEDGNELPANGAEPAERGAEGPEQLDGRVFVGEGCAHCGCRGQQRGRLDHPPAATTFRPPPLAGEAGGAGGSVIGGDRRPLMPCLSQQREAPGSH